MSKILNKREILKGKYVFPDNIITLKYTTHFKERLEERGNSLDCIPTMVMVTKKNIYSGKANKDKKLTTVVIKLDYTLRKDMFLCLNPFNGSCISIWFRRRKK